MEEENLGFLSISKHPGPLQICRGSFTTYSNWFCTAASVPVSCCLCACRCQTWPSCISSVRAYFLKNLNCLSLQWRTYMTKKPWGPKGLFFRRRTTNSARSPWAPQDSDMICLRKGIKTRLTVSSCTQVEDTTKMCIQYARCISSHKIWLPCQKFVSRFDQATMTKREYGKNWCRLFKRLLCSTKIKSSLHHDREKSRPYKPLLAKMLSGHPQL